MIERLGGLVKSVILTTLASGNRIANDTLTVQVSAIIRMPTMAWDTLRILICSCFFMPSDKRSRRYTSLQNSNDGMCFV